MNGTYENEKPRPRGRPRKRHLSREPGDMTGPGAMASSVHEIDAREAGLDDGDSGAGSSPSLPADPRKLKGKVVVAAVAGGLSEDDALVLAEWPRQEYEAYKIENPRFAQVLARKEVEYKRDLLKPINAAVKEGDAKMAQWVLERKHAEDFGKKRPGVPEARENPIAEIVRRIQEGGSDRTLPLGGRRVVITARETTVGLSMDGEAAAPITPEDLREPLDVPADAPGIRLPITISDEE